MNNWYKKAVFGTDPFGSSELSSKVTTSPFGEAGGDSYTGCLEPSDSTKNHHHSDFFSEQDHSDLTEEQLAKVRKLKKKKKLFLRKKIEEIISKNSSDNSWYRVAQEDSVDSSENKPILWLFNEETGDLEVVETEAIHAAIWGFEKREASWHGRYYRQNKVITVVPPEDIYDRYLDTNREQKIDYRVVNRLYSQFPEGVIDGHGCFASSISWYKKAQIENIETVKDPVFEGDFTDKYQGKQLNDWSVDKRDKPAAFFIDNFDLEEVFNEFTKYPQYAGDILGKQHLGLSKEMLIKELFEVFIENPQKPNNVRILDYAFSKFGPHYFEPHRKYINDIDSTHEYDPEKDVINTKNTLNKEPLVDYNYIPASKKEEIRTAQWGSLGPILPTFDPSNWMVNTYKKVMNQPKQPPKVGPRNKKKKRKEDSSLLPIESIENVKVLAVNNRIVITSSRIPTDNINVRVGNGVYRGSVLISSLGLTAIALSDNIENIIVDDSSHVHFGIGPEISLNYIRAWLKKNNILCKI